MRNKDQKCPDIFVRRTFPLGPLVFLFAADKKRILKRNALRDSFSPSRRSINVIQFVQLGRPELHERDATVARVLG